MSLQRYIRTLYFSGRALAQSKVAAARRHGELLDPKRSACSDCGRGATEYDHRDYNAPLIVDPVCRGCNARRGRAIWKRWKLEEWIGYATRRSKFSQNATELEIWMNKYPALALRLALEACA